ncbi:hypothetical protein ABGB18_37740 [Nonomuraea sp. B12E4]|uniref:hypothetical protein n=1 Tax=Nonomuraea sp. B12E4 TaxID=3153564 RepID=UPI00325C786E
MSVIKRTVGAAAVVLAITSGAAVLASPANAAVRPTSGAALAGYWDLVRFYPGTTAGAQACHAAGKNYGTYRCQIYTLGGSRQYGLEIWRE